MTKLIKYPKYTREQNLSCKLSDFDIRMIKGCIKAHWKRYEIAELFNVSEATINYWSMSPEKRKFKNRMYYLNSRFHIDPLVRYERQSRSVKRKLKLMPKFHEYLLQHSRKRYVYKKQTSTKNPNL